MNVKQAGSERSVIPLLAGMALFAFLLQLVVNLFGGYGYFRDELYYIACSDHLAAGYVDQPPLSIWMLAVSRSLFGDSLVAIRLFPALAFGSLVFFSGLIAREVGGRRYAQALAALATTIAPVYLSIFNFYSMNAFDILFWALGAWIVLRILNGGDERLWLWFGVVAGLGLENKLSMLFFGFALICAIVLTAGRRHLLSRWFWLGGAIALLLCLPHLVWQVQNGWPTLEFMRNAAERKNALVSPVAFFAQQLLIMHPLNALVWIPGLIYLLFSPAARSHRLFGLVYLVLFLVFALQKGKPYYLSPIYPALLAAGAVALEQSLLEKLPAARAGLLALLAAGGILAAPMVLPVLPPETFLRYARALHFKPGGEERDRPTALGQHFSDMFGWKEMAADVAKVYGGLPPEQRAKARIFADNYGEAGAIDFFGKPYGLPKAMSNHNSYWFWGPGDFSGDVLIIIGGEMQDHLRSFRSCRLAAVHNNRYARSFETGLPIYVCEHVKQPPAKIWPSIRSFI